MISLTADDRCDRCGAQAHYHAKKPGGGELMFCSHHYKENRDALLEGYWLVDTDVPMIVPTPVPALAE